MSAARYSKTAFETVIEAQLLENRYVRITSEVFDRERASFLETVHAFILEIQTKGWAELESPHSNKTRRADPWRST